MIFLRRRVDYAAIIADAAAAIFAAAIFR